MFSKPGQESAVPARRGLLARLPLWERGLAAAVAVALTCSAVGGPVHVEVVDVGIEDGHAVLTLNREPSKEWRETFLTVVDTKDFYRLAPDGWTHKRERWVSFNAYDPMGNMLRVRDVPVEAASLRKLMRAVRDAVERTNAAKPSEDPPRADSSLNGVLEEVFGKGPGEPVRVHPGVVNGNEGQ